MLLSEVAAQAWQLILQRDPDLVSAVTLSLNLATGSTVLAALVGVPIGFAIGLSDFRGKRLAVLVLNTLMACPTVVIGLLVYTLISRSGPLGSWGLLFTPSGIILGQFLLALPLVMALALTATHGLDKRIWSTAQTLGAGPFRCAWTMFVEGRFVFLAVIIAGFARVFAEIGVSLMLGGNIRFYTRTITTAIALETSKGQFALGLALGAILLIVALGVNIALQLIQGKAVRHG